MPPAPDDGAGVGAGAGMAGVAGLAGGWVVVAPPPSVSRFFRGTRGRARRLDGVDVEGHRRGGAGGRRDGVVGGHRPAAGVGRYDETQPGGPEALRPGVGELGACAAPGSVRRRERPAARQRDPTTVTGAEIVPVRAARPRTVVPWSGVTISTALADGGGSGAGLAGAAACRHHMPSSPSPR